MNDSINRQAVIDVVTFECGEWKGLAKEINKQIQNLPSVESERWSTCFDCPLSHGCPAINGCTNEQAMQYAGKIPNDCPMNGKIAEPERKKESWNRITHDAFHCPNCGHTFIVVQGQSFMNFCPNCNADMRGEQDE